jgi:hypothetical protein
MEYVIQAQKTLDFLEYDSLMFQADVNMTWAEIMRDLLTGG